MLKTIRKSIVHNQQLQIIYMSDDGQITKRRVKPYKVSKSTFVAYCYLRRSTRTFKIDNALAAVPVTTRERAVV